MLPKISIVTCTYNGERVIKDYLKYIFLQDYPKEKIELILADGGSTDKTLDIIKEYIKKYPKIIKLIYNKKQYSIGKGFGMDIATRKAKGEFIIQIDQDNLLIQKDWLSNSINLLINNKDISAVQSRLFIDKDASVIDKYINALGIEDPFAVNYSLNAQITLNPKKFNFNKKGKYFTYIVDKNNFYYAGDNGFIIRKRDFLESGGYTQDIDNFYRMAYSNKKYKIAISPNIVLYHKTSTSLKHMIEKRAFYIGHYIINNYNNRDFHWFDLNKNNFSQNFRFIKTIIFNLIFIPGVIQSIKMLIKQKKSFWLIHPFVLFLITISYIYSYFYYKIFRNQKEAKI